MSIEKSAMGAALIRKCWDVQEEKWGKKDDYENESTDQTSCFDYYFDYQFHSNSSIHSTERRSV